MHLTKDFLIKVYCIFCSDLLMKCFYSEKIGASTSNAPTMVLLHLKFDQLRVMSSEIIDFFFTFIWKLLVRLLFKQDLEFKSFYLPYFLIQFFRYSYPKYSFQTFVFSIYLQLTVFCVFILIQCLRSKYTPSLNLINLCSFEENSTLFMLIIANCLLSFLVQSKVLAFIVQNIQITICMLFRKQDESSKDIFLDFILIEQTLFIYQHSQDKTLLLINCIIYNPNNIEISKTQIQVFELNSIFYNLKVSQQELTSLSNVFVQENILIFLFMEKIQFSLLLLNNSLLLNRLKISLKLISKLPEKRLRLNMQYYLIQWGLNYLKIQKKNVTKYLLQIIEAYKVNKITILKEKQQKEWLQQGILQLMIFYSVLCFIYRNFLISNLYLIYDAQLIVDRIELFAQIKERIEYIIEFALINYKSFQQNILNINFFPVDQPSYAAVKFQNQQFYANKRQAITLNATLGSFFFGYQLVNISSIQSLFKNKNKLTEQQANLLISFITAVLPLVAIIGSLAIKPLMQRFLARKLMMLIDIFSIISMVAECYQLTFWPIFIARMGIGFTVGINSGLVPQYIYSVTPKKISGSVCSLHQVMLMLGITFGYTMGFIINDQNVNDQFAWRILFIVPVFLLMARSLILAFFLQYQIPSKKLNQKQIIRLERYFYKVYEGFENTTASIRSSMTSIEDVNQGIFEIQLFGNRFIIKGQQKRCSYNMSIFSSFKSVFWHQRHFFYARQLFMDVTEGNAEQSQILIILLGLAQVAASFFGGMTTQRVSKKVLLLSGLFGMSILLGTIFYFQDNQAIVITCIFIHAIFYNFSIGQLLMYYYAKMLQSTGVVMVLNWFMVFLVALSTESLIRYFGVGGMCLIFCVLLTICNVVLSLGVPVDDSTKFKSVLEQPFCIYSQSFYDAQKDIELCSTLDLNNSQSEQDKADSKPDHHQQIIKP